MKKNQSNRVVFFLIILLSAGFVSCTGRTPVEQGDNEKINTNTTNKPGKEPVAETADQNAEGVASGSVIPSENSKSTRSSDTEKNAKNTKEGPAAKELIYGITIGFMDLAFKIEGNKVSLRPEAEKAFSQIKKDGFIYVHMMEPFAKGYMKNFPSLPVQAVKLLKDKGFKVLLTINGSPFINESRDSDEKWIYRFFPGGDKQGKDDDGGLAEHKIRMKKFMDALKNAGLLDGMQFQLFDEPNSKKSFWGTFEEFEKLMEANIEILTSPAYGISKTDILFCAFTSNLMVLGDKSPDYQLPYWELAKSYKSNPRYNGFPFSFNWYPVKGGGEKSKDYSAADIKIKPMPEGAWITGMNVTAYMTKNNLLGKGGSPGYRTRKAFTEKLADIDAYGKANQLAGIYIFNLITRNDESNEKGRISTGLFNTKGCPRHEYKELLEFLKRPQNFELCPEPRKEDF